jgi:hypothetical protein
VGEDARMTATREEAGVLFPAVDGRRSTTATGQAIVADAARAADVALGARIAGLGRWRAEYIDALRDLTAVTGRSRAAALAAARAGLRSMAARMVLRSGGADLPLERAGAAEPAVRLGTRTIAGTARPLRELVVPYRGRALRGGALRAQLERWVERGVVEPSFAGAVREVAEHPEWLALPGRAVALVGAGAEMGPLEPLCAWGARVLAVDVPKPEIWRRVERIAAAGAGSVAVPVADAAEGVDVGRDLPAARAWLREAAGGDDLVLGMHAYADGAQHVQVTAAVDALAADLLKTRPRTAFAALATPTDAYLVDRGIVEAARRAWSARGLRATLQAPLRAVARGRLFAPAYAGEVSADDGRRWGVANVLVPQQGPNYALAKRLQRWRAVVAEDAGHPVSFNVAPASWTRSVTANRLLAAAYAGAHRFGVEIFSPATVRVLMAAMLVHDLYRPAAARPDRHPEALFVEGAAHGGLWRTPYEPRSVLPLAALAGLPRTLRRGRRDR